MNIYLIRHGRQSNTLCNVDVPLSEAGIKQARLVGRRLAGYDIDALYSSELIRAVETANIINEYLEVPHIKQRDLKEIDFGDLEGLTDDEIKENFQEFLKDRIKCQADIPYPNGECGEDVYNRSLPIIKDILKTDNKNIAIVTHGTLIRSLLVGILGVDFSKKLLIGRVLENCGITHIEYDDANHRFTIERINDYSHLEQDKMLLRRYYKKGF